MVSEIRPSIQTRLCPPFTLVTALRKVRLVEDAWNSRDPRRVALISSENSVLRSRDQVVTGRVAIRRFLAGQWDRELDFRLVNELWAFTDDRIAARLRSEWRDADGQWRRGHGNALWEFDENGLISRQELGINSIGIAESDRTFLWPAPGARPEDHAGISDVR